MASKSQILGKGKKKRLTEAERLMPFIWDSRKEIHPPNLEKFNVIGPAFTRTEEDESEEEAQAQVFVPHFSPSFEREQDPDSPPPAKKSNVCVQEGGQAAEPQAAVPATDFPGPSLTTPILRHRQQQQQQQQQQQPQAEHATEVQRGAGETTTETDGGVQPEANATEPINQLADTNPSLPSMLLPTSEGQDTRRRPPSKALEIRKLLSARTLPPTLVGQYMAVWSTALTTAQQEDHKLCLEELGQTFKETQDGLAEALEGFMKQAVELAPSGR